MIVQVGSGVQELNFVSINVCVSMYVVCLAKGWGLYPLCIPWLCDSYV